MIDRREFVQSMIALGAATSLRPASVLFAVPNQELKTLADAALSTAKQAGASYADIRINRYRNQFIFTRDRRVQNIVNTEDFGFGVRVIVDAFAADIASVPSTQLAVSPDGRSVAFVAAAPGERPALWIRALDATAPQVLAGTEHASYPFWSPDSRSLGFFTQDEMKRVDVAGGAPLTLCSVETDARGGTWNRDGVIVFARGTTAGLSQVSAAGGVATPLLSLREGENSYRWPVFLPDGRHFLFHIRGGKGRGVYLGSLGSADVTLVLDDVPYSAIYSPLGYLLTVRDGTLLAYPFDENQRRVVGEPIRVTDHVGGSSTLRASFGSERGSVNDPVFMRLSVG